MANHTRGWWISEDGSDSLSASFRENIEPAELGVGTVTIDVDYSALNYKDALALGGSRGVVRTTPLIPGIDAAGIIRESSDPGFAVGEKVVLTGWGYGESRHGGLAETLVADSQHLVKIPGALSSYQAACFGTAGFTAALAISALEQSGVVATGGLPIAVTGAAGAVGSWSVALLARRGYQVSAITGRPHEAQYLRSLGAQEVLSRHEMVDLGQRPLGSETFGGVIDVAGGELLAALLSKLASNGVAVACGLAGGSSLPTTVLPFILRGISLIGINSVTQDTQVRERAWSDLAELASGLPLETMATTIELGSALSYAPTVLEGATRGRVVVNVRA